MRLVIRWCRGEGLSLASSPHPVDAGGCVCLALAVDAIEEQAMGTDVEVERAAETLDQSYRAGAGFVLCETCLLDAACCSSNVLFLFSS